MSKYHSKQMNMLALFGMMSAIGMADYPHQRERIHLGPPPELSPDHIERMKRDIAKQRRQKRRKRGKR